MAESIFSLVGSEPNQNVKLLKVEQVFSAMDTNKDGVVTKEEFVKYCKDDVDVFSAFTYLP